MGIKKYIGSKLETAQEQRKASTEEKERLKKIEEKVQIKEKEKLEKEEKKLRTVKAVERGKEKARRGGVTKRAVSTIKKGAIKMGERLDEQASKTATPQDFGELFSIAPKKPKPKPKPKQKSKPKPKKKSKKPKPKPKPKSKPENMWF